jgi:hypothetical protein
VTSLRGVALLSRAKGEQKAGATTRAKEDYQAVLLTYPNNPDAQAGLDSLPGK